MLDGPPTNGSHDALVGFHADHCHLPLFWGVEPWFHNGADHRVWPFEEFL